MLIPRPTYKEEESEPENDGTIKPYVTPWFRWFWNVPDWKCLICGAVMFGRVENCVYCRIRHNTLTPRPSSYVLMPFED